MADEPTQFIDAEAYKGGGEEKISFRLIVLETLRRIGTIAGKEFAGGYWTIKEAPIGTGGSQTIKTYTPDSREEYANSVDYLFDILSPHFDEQMQKEITDFEKWAEEEKNRLYLQHTIEEKRVNMTNDRAWKSDSSSSAFKTDKVKVIKRKLFRLLNAFLKRNRYMEGKSFEEGI